MFGGTCGGAIGDSASIAVAITGTSTQNGTATCSAGTWSYSPTTALSVDGAYSITATQTDAAGNTGTTGAQSITVDRTLPPVTLTSVNGTVRTFPYTTNVTATTVGGACGTAAGDSAIVAIGVVGSTTQNGTAPCTAGVWTYTFSPTLSASGSYDVTATQTDTASNVGTSGVKNITIQTTAPVVTLTAVNGTARTFPYSTNATVTTIGGACTTAAGVNPTVSVVDHGREHAERNDRVQRRRVDLHPHHCLLGGRRVLGDRDAERHREQRRHFGRAGDHGRQDAAGGHAHLGERHRPHLPLPDQRHRHGRGRHVRRDVGRRRDRCGVGHRRRQ